MDKKIEMLCNNFDFIRIHMARTQLELECEGGEWQNDFWQKLADAKKSFNSAINDMKEARKIQSQNKKFNDSIC